MPFKANAARRHHIPKQKCKVTNRAAYDASLRQRGSLTLWFSDAAIAAWQAAPRTTRGGQAWYSPLADTLMLRKRFVIETMLDILKSEMGLEHSRHRSVINAIVHVLSCLVAYAYRPGKPSISLTHQKIKACP